LVYQGKDITYNSLLKSGNRVAHALNKHGVGANTPVALMMSNCPEYVISLTGIYLAGGTLIPLNDMLGEKEIKYILQDSEAKVAIVDPNFLEVIHKIKSDLPQLETIIAICDENQCPEDMISWNAFQSNELEHDLYV